MLRCHETSFSVFPCSPLNFFFFFALSPFLVAGSGGLRHSGLPADSEHPHPYGGVEVSTLRGWLPAGDNWHNKYLVTSGVSWIAYNRVGSFCGSQSSALVRVFFTC